MPGGVGAFHGGLRHSLAGAAEQSLGAAGARVDMQTTRRTRQLPPTAMAAGREDRRAVLQSASALSVLLGAAGPAGAIADFRRAVEIFGSDGDMPPGLLEQFGARIGKTMDKNFIDSKRRPQPVGVGARRHVQREERALRREPVVLGARRVRAREERRREGAALELALQRDVAAGEDLRRVARRRSLAQASPEPRIALEALCADPQASKPSAMSSSPASTCRTTFVHSSRRWTL